MTAIVAMAATGPSSVLLPTRQTTLRAREAIISTMATTRLGRRQAAHLYVKEWLEFRGFSDEKAAGRLGVDRTTVWKWHKEPRRLTKDKIASLAALLDIEPEELYRPPSRPSLDVLIKDAPDDVQAMAVDIVKRLVGRGQ